MKLTRRLLLIIFSLGLVVSCSVGPSYIPPTIVLPCEWKNKNSEDCQNCENPQEEEDGEYLENWWEIFEDGQLNELENLAVRNNRNLFVAYERIQEYRALKGIAAASFYPQVTLNPLYTNTGELIKNYNTSVIPLLNKVPTVFRAHELLYFLPVSLSYEVDLWGKIRDQYKAAKYNWLASQKDYENILLSVTSNLAIAYYQIRAADTQLDLLLEVLKTREKSYQINKDRFDAGLTLYADVALAAEEINNVLIQYNEVERQRNLLEDQIAVLLGIPPSIFCQERMPLTGLPPCIPEGVPSEILIRRPDIAEAMYTTQAAHQLVKYAYTQFFPSLILTTTGGFESPVLRDFLKWKSRYWMEEVQVNQIVFDGFRTSYNLQLEIARFFESSGQYQEIVLEAFQEVEDSLSNLFFYKKEYDNYDEATQWARKVNQLYTDRFTTGVIDYIEVVNTERDLLNFQINLSSLQGYRYIATIQLIKALGGGW